MYHAFSNSLFCAIIFYLCRFREPLHCLLEITPIVAAAYRQRIAVLRQELIQGRPDCMRVVLSAQRYLRRRCEPHHEVHKKLDHARHILQVVLFDVAVGAAVGQFQPDFDRRNAL